VSFYDRFLTVCARTLTLLVGFPALLTGFLPPMGRHESIILTAIAGLGTRDRGLGTGTKGGGRGLGRRLQPQRAQRTQRTALTIAECRSRAFRISDRGLAGPSSAPTGPGAVAAGGAARPRSGPTRNPWAASAFRVLFFSTILFFSPRRGDGGSSAPSGAVPSPTHPAHGLRSARHAAGCAPPVATRRRPSRGLEEREGL